jgi:hypothetical protein
MFLLSRLGDKEVEPVRRDRIRLLLLISPSSMMPWKHLVDSSTTECDPWDLRRRKRDSRGCELDFEQLVFCRSPLGPPRVRHKPIRAERRMLISRILHGIPRSAHPVGVSSLKVEELSTPIMTEWWLIEDLCKWLQTVSNRRRPEFETGVERLVWVACKDLQIWN